MTFRVCMCVSMPWFSILKWFPIWCQISIVSPVYQKQAGASNIMIIIIYIKFLIIISRHLISIGVTEPELGWLSWLQEVFNVGRDVLRDVRQCGDWRVIVQRQQHPATIWHQYVPVCPSTAGLSGWNLLDKTSIINQENYKINDSLRLLLIF